MRRRRRRKRERSEHGGDGSRRVGDSDTGRDRVEQSIGLGNRIYVSEQRLRAELDRAGECLR
jgi:hypothetical protein